MAEAAITNVDQVPEEVTTDQGAQVCADPSPDQQQEEARAYTQRPMIPVELLTRHPGNVREDKQASTAFCRSVAKVGILTPLEITFEPGRGGYRVVDGNIRLDAAIKVGLKEVPYVFSDETADNEALQALHMVVTSRYRTDLTQREEAAALFRASELGMSASDIRKATGLKAGEVKVAIRAGTLTAAQREAMAAVDYEWTVDELALLAQFKDDAEAMERLLHSRTMWNPSPLKYAVQRLKEERAESKRRTTLLAELEAAGVQVEDELPKKAVYLSELRNGEAPMDANAHAGCPGRGATLAPWRGATPRYYCADPVLHEHVKAATSQPENTDSSTVRAEEPSLPRKVVIEGNLAWPAASQVRQEFLAEFLTRKSPPKELVSTIARFVTLQYLTMPEPLSRALASAKHSSLFDLNSRFVHQTNGQIVGKSSIPGLWMLVLAPIASAYEREMTGEGERRNTWREDKYSPCGYDDAGQWLRFCIEIGANHGWEPSPIERAIAEGRPYRGDAAEGEAPDPKDASADTVEFPGDIELSELDDEDLAPAA